MSAPSFSRDAAHSVFEALRPEGGQALDRAAFATYSLDLVSIAALVLSLSRAGEQELEAGPLAFVDAFEAIAQRIDIVYQADRLKVAARHFGVLHMLDRRLHGILPPRGSSFHPKLAIARYVGPGKTIMWRLWLGSRNLTGGQDREAGLLLVGRVGTRDGSRIPSIAQMAADLLEPVGWIVEKGGELANVRWRAPEGVRVRGVQWRRAGELKAFATAPRGKTRTIAISPFVDNGGLRVFEGGIDNLLLTTTDAAIGIDPRDNVSVATYRPPTLDLPMPVDTSTSAPPIDDVSVPEMGGLHAKLLLQRSVGMDRLWIGSANLTRRGMEGPNAELLAELDLPTATADALADFALDGEPFEPDKVVIDPEAAARRIAERALDDALASIVAADLELRREDRGLVLESRTDLELFLSEHRLDAWLLTRPDAVARWVPGEKSILLVPGGVPTRLETVLVCFRAERLLGDCPAREWAQAVPFPAHDANARDRAATASYIGLAGASAWLRAQLAGIVGVEGKTWTGAPRWDGSAFAGSVDALPLALEEVLAAWARDPDAFEERAGRLEETLTALGGELAAAPVEERDEAAIARWNEVVDFWVAIRGAMGQTA